MCRMVKRYTTGSIRRIMLSGGGQASGFKQNSIQSVETLPKKTGHRQLYMPDAISSRLPGLSHRRG